MTCDGGPMLNPRNYMGHYVIYMHVKYPRALRMRGIRIGGHCVQSVRDGGGEMQV